MSAAVAFENVGARYNGRAALGGVTAAFSEGTVTGIVGPNGAGKTTLLRAALGLLPLAGGSIRILKKPLAEWPREELARAAAYLPQGGDAKWPMLARDVVLLGRLPHRAAFSGPSAADFKAVDDALARSDAERFCGAPHGRIVGGRTGACSFCPRLGNGRSHFAGRRAGGVSRSGASIALDGTSAGRSATRDGGGRHPARSVACRPPLRRHLGAARGRLGGPRSAGRGPIGCDAGAGLRHRRATSARSSMVDRMRWRRSGGFRVFPLRQTQVEGLLVSARLGRFTSQCTTTRSGRALQESIVRAANRTGEAATSID